MNLTAASETTNSQILFGKVGNSVSSPKVFLKQFLQQISDTELFDCNITFSDFTNIFRFKVADVTGNEFSEQIVFKLEYADKFFVHLKLNGDWELNGETKFQINDIDWFFEEKENNPTSAFFVETLKVMLCLSTKVKVEIPSINYYFGVSFPSPLNTISEILQNRQLAYRLMVIEKALQTTLPFPRTFIAGEEVENIAFCYHAIVDRQFEWDSNSLTFFLLTTEENLKYLPAENTSYHLTFPTLNEVRIIFNQELLLGQFLIDIEEAAVENYEEVKENFTKLSGQPVKTVIKSLNGKIKYTSLNVPNLHKKFWKSEIQNLIDLDEKFNSVFLDRYFKLASSTLEGLSEEQKESITERPKLSIKGFD